MSIIKNIILPLVILFTAIGAAQAAYSLVLPQVSGSDVISGENRTIQSSDKGLVVVFLSAKCPCSKSHTREIAELAKEFSEFNFVAVHSNMDESEELAKNYFTQLNLPFPVLRDADAKIADRFKAAKTPHVFVLAPSAEPMFEGGMSDSKDCGNAKRKYLREALGEMRAGRVPRERRVRTLGCSISRRKNA